MEEDRTRLNVRALWLRAHPRQAGFGFFPCGLGVLGDFA